MSSSATSRASKYIFLLTQEALSGSRYERSHFINKYVKAQESLFTRDYLANELKICPRSNSKSLTFAKPEDRMAKNKQTNCAFFKHYGVFRKHKLVDKKMLHTHTPRFLACFKNSQDLITLSSGDPLRPERSAHSLVSTLGLANGQPGLCHFLPPNLIHLFIRSYPAFLYI